MKQYVAILIGIMFVLSAGIASAETYMYMEDGVLVFTDTPRSGSVSLSTYKSVSAQKPNEHIIKTYQKYIKQASEKYGIDAKLIKAVIEVESNFNEFAISSKGAMGLMQLMPATAAELGVFNPFDPWSNIDAGTRYLKRLITKFDGNIHLALAAYNAGPTVVAKNNAVPPYAETHKYIKKVFDRYQGKKQVAVSKPQKKNRIYRIVMDDGSIFFTNDENEARKASKL